MLPTEPPLPTLIYLGIEFRIPSKCPFCIYLWQISVVFGQRNFIFTENISILMLLHIHFAKASISYSTDKFNLHSKFTFHIGHSAQKERNFFPNFFT